MQHVSWNWLGEEKEKQMKLEDVSRSQLEIAIDEWIIGRYAERNRKILKRRLVDGITYERLAEEFDLSTQQIKNIVYKCENKLFKKMKIN
jgi:DNA-directed RNA polymerase specialized sigma24 family protein